MVTDTFLLRLRHRFFSGGFCVHFSEKLRFGFNKFLFQVFSQAEWLESKGKQQSKVEKFRDKLFTNYAHCTMNTSHIEKNKVGLIKITTNLMRRVAFFAISPSSRESSSHRNTVDRFCFLHFWLTWSIMF